MLIHRFHFRTRWLGYDRVEVNRFLDQVAADRQFLKDRVNHLESVVGAQSGADEAGIATRLQDDPRVREAQQLQNERLKDLTREMAVCVRNSASLLQKAHELFNTDMPPSVAAPQPEPGSLLTGLTEAEEPEPHRATPATRRLAYVGLALLAVGGGAVTAVTRTPAAAFHSSATLVAQEASPSRQEGAPRPEPAALVAKAPDAPSDESSQAADQQGLALTLTATSPCWIRSSVDGAHAVERLMQPGEALVVWGHEEVVLRVGDGAALTVTINGLAAAPLGRAGEVVTRRITRETVKLFLQNQA